MADVVVEQGVTRQSGRAEAELYLTARLGPAATVLLRDGAPYALADQDAVLDYRATAAWLADAGEATPWEELTGEDYARRSRLVQAPLAAVAAELLLEQGPAVLERAWRGDATVLTGLDSLYAARLDRLVEEHRHWMDRRRRERGLLHYELRGFCFAHEGYRVYDGYLSAMAARSLARARRLGANAISLTPFGFYRAPDRPEIRWSRRTARRAGGESDESIAVAAATARRLGVKVMLKPHLWGHGWCGDIAMRTEDDWRRWFDEYGEFLVHQALLAERLDLDWLSIGCELVGTTHRTREWRDLARRARRLFAGGITYAANWGEEMERIGFAAELDAVGVDFYFPLSDRERPTDDDLLRGAAAAIERTAALCERYGRPILLTEIGYPARFAPWRDPFRVERGDRSFAADQARCFDAFFAALAGTDAIRGFFIWKWPTLDDWSERDGIDYWPAGEATLEAIARGLRLQDD